MFVIYVDYGQEGMTFRCGPPELRRRVGLWAHFYRRVHPVTCSCIHCCVRVCAGPVAVIPEGRVTGRMYPLF